MKCCFITLGCDKNTVDSEKIFKSFIDNYDLEITLEPECADIVILNTCAFIKDAKQESIDYIKYLTGLKRKGKVKKILVTGCLVAENAKTNAYNEILKDVDVVLELSKYLSDLNNVNDRASDVLSFSSFLKICDGCNKFCSYCIIPYLRGRLKSNTIHNLVEETTKLAKNGTKELSIVGQDILSYGYDMIDNEEFNLKSEKPIVTLINKISQIKGIEWIRLLYCYPEEIDDSVIDLIKNNKKVLPYIDMPIQHASDRILKLMNRNTDKESIKNIIHKLRKEVPDICIRTTLIVGFPSESEEDFIELVDFVKEMRFDKLGVFTYSREKLSKSYDFPNQIDEDIKNRRRKIILDVQKKIVEEKNKEKIGKMYKSIVEGKIINSKDKYIVRPYFNARDIDDKLIVHSNTDLISGSFVNVKITKYKCYDLEGEIV